MKNLILLLVILSSTICNAQQEEIKKLIRSESIGGNLDFRKVAEEQASGAPFILYDKILYNKKDFAILMWGAKVKSLGINSFKEIVKLWEEINSRSLTEPERKALKTGFKMKF